MATTARLSTLPRHVAKKGSVSRIVPIQAPTFGLAGRVGRLHRRQGIPGGDARGAVSRRGANRCDRGRLAISHSSRGRRPLTQPSNHGWRGGGERWRATRHRYPFKSAGSFATYRAPPRNNRAPFFLFRGSRSGEIWGAESRASDFQGDLRCQRTYLVTGASEGIGLETARLAAASGAAVLMVARDAVKLQAGRRRASGDNPARNRGGRSGRRRGARRLHRKPGSARLPARCAREQCRPWRIRPVRRCRLVQARRDAAAEHERPRPAEPLGGAGHEGAQKRLDRQSFGRGRDPADPSFRGLCGLQGVRDQPQHRDKQRTGRPRRFPCRRSIRRRCAPASAPPTRPICGRRWCTSCSPRSDRSRLRARS